MDPAGRAASGTSHDAEEFVRFCYRRRRVGWPELYDEMCAVATRGAFRGMGHSELAELGIGFSLFETPRLAELVRRVVAEEQALRAADRPSVVRLDARRPAAPSPLTEAAEDAPRSTSPLMAASGA